VGAFEKKYDHYPVVGKALISAIVARFKPPFVLPHVDFFFEETTFAAPANTVIEDDWNRDGRIGKSTLLPISGDTCRVKIVWKGADAQKDGDLPIVIEVPDASAYRFLGPTLEPKIETTLRTILKTPIFMLYSSQKLSSKPADNVIVVRTGDGRKIGERQLHGSRDLLKAQAGDGCRDAAVVQAWLAKIPDPDKPGEMLYKKTKTIGKGKDAVTKMLIDGKWDAKCVTALKLFQSKHAPAATDSAAILLALRTKAQ